MTKMKYELIFCIGYNKTGTTSLYQSIANLGFPYYPGSMMAQAEFLMSDIYRGLNTNDFEPLYLWIDECIRLGVCVVKDVPFSLPNVWKKVYEKYPNAKFVLSERDSPEQWYNSIYNFHQKAFAEFKDNPAPSWNDVAQVDYRYKGYLFQHLSMLNNDSRESLPYDKESMINSYNSHNNEVKEFFKDKGNFISLNVSNDNAYLKLCSFLNAQPIESAFLKLKITTEPGTWDISYCNIEHAKQKYKFLVRSEAKRLGII